MMVHRPPTRHPRTEAKVVLLSGLSDPATCALTPQQTAFLGGLNVPEAWKIYWNFPYVPSATGRPRPPLWRASWHNLRQFLLAGLPAYRNAARRHWQALAESADRLVVITLSCGLEIVNQCLGSDVSAQTSHVLALGPVAWQTPPVPYTLVQGGNDYISKLFFRKCDIRLSGGGHLDYVTNPRVGQILNEILRADHCAIELRPLAQR